MDKNEIYTLAKNKGLDIDSSTITLNQSGVDFLSPMPMTITGAVGF